MPELTGKKKRFFEEYIIDRNGTRAAIAAGYAEKSAKQRAYKLLHGDVAIIEALKEYDIQQHKEKTAERDEVIEFLTSVMRGEVVDNVPLFVGDGEQMFKEGAPPARDRLKAAEMLGKHYAMFTEKHSVEGEGIIQIIDDIPRGDKDA